MLLPYQLLTRVPRLLYHCAIFKILGRSVGGVAFTRWGKSECPSTEGTQLLYAGMVVGSDHREGGSAEYLCLHNVPQFLQTTAGLQNQRTWLYGTEYRHTGSPALGNVANHDAPCSVCYTPARSTEIVIAGRTSCPDSWTREYYGYYMSEGQYIHHKSKAPVCIDVNAESVAGSGSNTVRSLLYFMETTCIGVLCPPYFNGAEITCVVCTK